MKTFKEFQDLKHKVPSIETSFGSHSQKKSDNEKDKNEHPIPSIETSFGSHSVDKKDIQEKTADSGDVDPHGHTGGVETDMHHEIAPINKKKLTGKESAALKEYSDSSTAINGMLHQHDQGYSISPQKKQTYGETASLIDSAIEKHKTTGSMHVFTGVRFSPAKHFKKVKGVVPETQKLKLPAFTSTSSSLDASRAFARDTSDSNDENHGIDSTKFPHRHILKIHVPEGSHAMSMMQHTFAPSEREILLHRGHTIEVHHQPEDIGRQTMLWHAKIVGHEKADLDTPK